VASWAGQRRPIVDDLSAFCCLNPACADVGKRGHGNLTVTMRYGPNKSRRMLRCRTCTTRFSERKGTPLFDARLPAERVNDVLAHVAEGIGTRKTARLTGVSKDTVTRYTRLAGDHAEQLHDELVPFSPEDR
jgi:transposase-like protein